MSWLLIIDSMKMASLLLLLDWSLLCDLVEMGKHFKRKDVVHVAAIQSILYLSAVLSIPPAYSQPNFSLLLL